MTFNEDREQSYTCVYTPASEGEYRVSIRFAGREIPKSPFRVKVQDQPGDASKVVAAGPGLQSREVFVGRRTHFEVNTKGVHMDARPNASSCTTALFSIVLL